MDMPLKKSKRSKKSKKRKLIMDVIIPGLPNDISLNCLIRLPFSQLHSLRLVCKAWKSQIKLLELLRLRKSAGKAQSLFVLALNKYKESDIIVFEPETGLWSEIPPIPNGWLQFCRIVVVGSELVVMGGSSSQRKCSVDSVFIFNFLSSKWRCGAKIPDGDRVSFACATVDDRTVFIAGGFNSNKEQLKSVWTYDVPTNSWNQLPDMARKHIWCSGLFHRGKFHVINKYPTNPPADFRLEIFDMSSSEWSEKRNKFSEILHASRNCFCVVGSDQKLYTCHGGTIVEVEDDTCRFVAKLPSEKVYAQSMIYSPGYLWLKTQSKNNSSHHSFYKMDMKDHIWTKLETPVKFSGCNETFCGCFSL